MAPVDLQYLQIVHSKGRAYGYYRRGVLRARINGEPGSAEFLASYQAIHAQAEAASAAHRPDGPFSVKGSLRALWLAYRASPEWHQIKPVTQDGYARLIEPLLPKYGDGLISDLKPAWIIRRMDEMTPARANHFLAVIRLLLNWSVPRGWITHNPATAIKRRKHTPESHRVWTAAEITSMTSAKAGAISLPVTIALYTGQRLGDVLKLPWSAYDGSSITIAAQGKTGARVVVPCLPELQSALNAADRRAVVICTRPDGHAWKERHFKGIFMQTRKRLGLPDDLHFHGLRHSAAARMAEAGCSPHEIAAITGHKSLSMVSRYTQQVSQDSLAKAAITRLRNNPRKQV